MVKVCTNCTAEYWARWRNEPAQLCPDCRADAVLCTACGAMQRAPVDAAQLPLFPTMHIGRRAPARGADETYTPPPKSATQKEKRRSPYH